MRAAAGWDPELTRMLGLSATGHALVLVLGLVVFPLLRPAPLPIVAYTVELTDPNALGGRMAPGRPDLPMGPRAGAAASSESTPRLGEPAPKPEPKAEPVAEPAPPKPVERARAEPPAPVEPAVKLPSPEKPAPKPEAKKPPEPKPAPKPEAAKPEPAKVEPKKAEKPAEPAKPDAKQAAAAKPEAKPQAAAAAKPADTKPAGKPTGKSDGGDGDGGDEYATAAAKWRTKAATGGGGGLGGADTGEGPMGTPGYGAGGGQVVGFEFLAYQQRVVTTVKGVWTNAMTRAGLVARVRFRIAANGDVSGVRMEQPSGDPTFDGSALRAVERANPLPPPPARYVNEFREFVIEFHSEDQGGQAAG
jgi:colicin import membrane protein